MSQKTLQDNHIPQAVAYKKPQLGQKFHTIDKAFLIYNSYTRESKFSARMSNNYRSKKDNLGCTEGVCLF